MASDEVNPLFAQRVIAIARSAAALAGGGRALAREWGIARSTIQDLIAGRVSAPSAGTLDAITSAFQDLNLSQQWRVLSGADLMVGVGANRALEAIERARLDPSYWTERVNTAMKDWKDEQVRREANEEPPQASHSA
jgi:hypothetical protein